MASWEVSCFMTTASCLPNVILSKELGAAVLVISSVLEGSRQGLKVRKILKSSVPMICWKG